MPLQTAHRTATRRLSLCITLLSLFALLLPLQARGWGNPNSAHLPEWCEASDGMSGRVLFTHPTDIALVLQTGCDIYAKAHSTPGTTYFWEPCTPIVSPPPGYIGAHRTFFQVTGIIKGIRNSDGMIWTAGTGERNLAICSCADKDTNPKDGFGEDGLCYCPAGYDWDASISRCIPYVDILPPPPPPPETCDASSTNPSFGNPIEPLTGTKTEVVHTGLFIGDTEFTLTYTNRYRTPEGDAVRATVLGGEQMPPAFGQQWFSNFHRSLSIESNYRNTLSIRGDGRITSFYKTHSNSVQGLFSKQPSIRDTITSISPYWSYYDPIAHTLDAYWSGRLDYLVTLNGTWLTFGYNSAITETTPQSGLLTTIQDPYGRTLTFTYQKRPSGAVLIDTVTAPDGQTVRAGYDAADNLSTLTWADGTTRTFLYERSDLPWALTGIIDETGTRYATFGYDDQGRARSTEHAGGVNRYQVDYATPPRIAVSEAFNEAEFFVTRTHNWIAPTGVTVTQPNGSTIRLEAAQDTGVARLTSRSQPAGSGCGASTRHQAYDANSNLIQRDDFNGTRACMAYDLTRNLMIRRIEGLPNTTACSTALASGAPLPEATRQTHLQWHPQWALITQRAEPNRITTYVYNGQPDPSNGNRTLTCAPGNAWLPGYLPIAVLCKQIEQPTSDPDGSKGFSAAPTGTARITEWTYDVNGKTLTERDADGRTLTYTYASATTATHTAGDLLSLSDTLGVLTTHTAYDRAGRLLESQDTNGIITRLAYDTRGRLNSQNVGGHLTRYTYTSVGQLSSVTQPDGYQLTYTYDAAHRLTGITDTLGNRIATTYDAAGNLTRETIADPNNQLTRAVTRHHDALQRVQRTVQGD